MADNMQDVGLRAKIEGMGAFLRDSQRINKEAQTLSQRMGQVARDSISASKGIGSILDPLGKIGLAVFGVQQLARAFSNFGGAILGPSMSWEQYQVQFETLLGSADAGLGKLEELSEFAQRTPFTLPSVVDASKQLLAYGFAAEELLPMLNKVGDAAAGLGDDAFPRIIRALGQMRARTKVSSQEMLQLTEVGIPAWQILADAIGISVSKLQDLVSQGVVPANAAIQAILTGLGTRFGGLMDKQSKTLQGMLSNLEDWWYRARTILSEGAFEGAKTTLGGLLKSLNTQEAEQTLRDWGQAIGEFTSQAITLGQEVLPKIGQSAKDALSAWENLGEKGQRGLLGMAVLLVAGGPIIGGLRMAAAAAFGLGRAVDFAAIKMIALVGAIGTVGAAWNATMFSINEKSFDQWGNRFNKEMENFGRQVTAPITGLVGKMLGEDAAKALDELNKVGEGIFELDRKIAQDMARLRVEEEKYQAALKGRDEYGRTLEFAARYEAEERALKNIEEYKRRLDQYEIQRTRLIEQQSMLQGDALAGGFKGGVEKAGDVFDWFLTQTQKGYDALRRNIKNNPIIIDILTSGSPFDIARGVARNAGSISDIFGQMQRQERGSIFTFAGNLAANVGKLNAALKAAGQSAKGFNFDLGNISSGTSIASHALQKLQQELRDTEMAFRAFSDPRLTGMQAMEDEIFALQMAVKQARLEELGLAADAIQATNQMENSFDVLAAQQREIAEGIPIAMQRYEYDVQKAMREAEQIPATAPAESEASKKLDQLERVLEVAQLRFDLTYEPQLRALRETAEDLEGKNKELTFQEALDGLVASWAQAEKLLIAVENQEAVLDDLKLTSDDIYSTRSDQLSIEQGLTGENQKQLDIIKEAYEVLQKAWSIPTPPVHQWQHAPGHVPELADGGSILNGGLVKVGERGSELVSLPTGARVIPHSALQAASVTRSYQDTYNIYGASQPMNVMNTIRRHQRFDRITQGR